uniref:Putative HNH homing endonuclease n=1 Tax=Jenufa perforata TaxID=993091 RepID=A0A0S2LNB5_9CHLO|nr:putative HNH homing endonuclease [Jenufa perforata]ALO62925.1 putative HNH homing endonuclease [Jenufa perforata]
MTPKLTKKSVEELANKRDHILLSFPENYKSVQDKIELKCLVCNSQWKTSVHSYKNAKNGCKNCKNKKASIVHKNKITSSSTKLLISQKARLRPSSLLGVKGSNHPKWKGGYGRDKNNPSNQDYVWKNAVKKRCQYMCIITSKKKNTMCHHLNGWNLFPDQRYDILNGVLLHRDIHRLFHDTYKYGNNTELQFKEFLLNEFNLNWEKIKVDLQHGNHHPNSPKSL